MNASEAKSILVIVIGLMLLDQFIFHIGYLQYAALGIGLLSIVFEKAGSLIVKIWMKIGHVLGYINTRIILSIVFFIFLFPVAVLYRMFNKNPLMLKKENKSLFIVRNHTFSPKDLENIW